MGFTRVIEFDYIRTLSLFGILVCHSLLDKWFEVEWMGRFLGMTFNFLFLILSAFLFGLGWENKRYPKYNFDFFKLRMIRLSRSYYPYLVLLFSVIYFLQGEFPIDKILFHIFYLPWFNKVNGYGHLWFLTMIVICYIGCLLATRIPIKNLKLKYWWITIIIVTIIDYITSLKGLPGYIFPYLVGYIFVFIHSSLILKKVRDISNILNLVQFILITSINIIIFYLYKLDPYSFLSYILGIIEALSIFCLCYNVLKKLPESKTVMFLSSISFEVYLVHEFFLGNYSIYKYFQNPFLSIIIFLGLSILLGYILHSFSKIFSR